MTEQLLLADIVGVYGIKGWVKIRSYLEDPNLLKNLSNISLSPGRNSPQSAPLPIKVLAVRVQGKGLVAQLDGVNDRSAAEGLRGWTLQAPETALPPTAEGDHYWRDLVGLAVWCRVQEREVLLGVVDYLLETGANDVLVVKASEGSVDDAERLIPWIPGDVVLDVDTQEGAIWVDWYLDV